MQKKKLGCCKDNCSTDGIRGMYVKPTPRYNMSHFYLHFFLLLFNCSVCQGYPLKHILQMAQLSKTEAAEVLKASTVYTSRTFKTMFSSRRLSSTVRCSVLIITI